MDDNKLNLTDNGTLRNSYASIIIQDEKTLSEQTKHEVMVIFLHSLTKTPY